MARSLAELAESYSISYLTAEDEDMARISSLDDENPADGHEAVAVGHLVASEIDSFESDVDALDAEIVFEEPSSHPLMERWVVVA